MTPRAYDLAHNVFDGMWFAFPTPFKRGDILVDTGLNGKIMVLDELAGATEDGREKLERFGDATNMTAYGYFVEPGSGEVYYECMHDYMRLEYFRSELTGHERVLYTVRTELMTGKETDQPESNSKERRTMENSVCFETSLHDIFSDLLSAPWQGKPIWEYIRAGELTAAPAFVGDLYHSAKTKIMFVGRDLNGWTEPIGDCSTLENTVQSITTQDAHHAFSTLVDRCGVPQSDGKKCYYHKNSRFFRLIKQVLEYFGESDIDTDATWYDDSKQWHQRFVWANLYCIGPRDPENMAASHFDAAAVKQSIDTYVKLMKLYIEHYQPDVVVFITDVPGWFVRWKRKNSFRSIVDEYSEDIEKPAEDVIVATGKIANSQIVVCKRPDKPGTPYHRVQMMAKTIYEHIQRTVS